MESVVAGAALVLVSAALAAVLITTSQVSRTAQEVTRGRLLAQSHLEQLRTNGHPQELSQNGLTSVAQQVDHNGQILWQVIVTGPNLPKPLDLVAGP